MCLRFKTKDFSDECEAKDVSSIVIQIWVPFMQRVYSGFKNIHSGERIQKVLDSPANLPDTCGRKVYPERKSCIFKNISIHVMGLIVAGHLPVNCHLP